MEKSAEKSLWIILAVLFLLPSLKELKTVISPLLTGLCLALFLEPLRSFFERLLRPMKQKPKLKKLLGPVTVLLTFAAVMGGGALLIRFAGPKLLESLRQAMELLPTLGEQAGEVSRSISAQTQLDLSQLPTKLIETLISSLTGAADQLLNCGTSLLLGTILAVWMLLGKEKIFAFWTRLSALSSNAEQLERDTSRCRSCFAAFVRGQLTEAAILGLGCLGGMLLFHKPFAGLISLIIGITALVPVAGAWAGGAFGALLLFSRSTADGMWFLVFIILLQQLENNLIYPRVMGKTVGLPGAIVLLAVLTGSTLFGIPGMLLMVPTASFLWQKLESELPQAP